MRENFNILLINPWIYDFTAYDFWSKPLGLLYIASILSKEKYKISYIDCLDRYNSSLLKLTRKKPLKNDEFGRGAFYKEEIAKPDILKNIPRRYSRYGITEEIFLKELKKISKPKTVLVTSIMTYWYPGVFRVIELVNRIYPDVPIILGGIYSTLCYAHAKKISGADYVIKGNRIESLLLLLEKITGNKGNNYHKYNDYLDIAPYPGWDLYGKLDYICIITSRGCPFRCSYCASHQLSPELRFRNPAEVVREIAFWEKNKKVRDFVFYDDALLMHPQKKIVAVLNEIINMKMQLRFHLPNGIHAREIDDKIAEKMFQAGIHTIRLGFETVNHYVQLKTGGKINNIEFKNAVNCFLKAGFKTDQIGAYLLIGLPGQSVQEVKNSINFVKECGAHPRLARFSPIPGTKIWKKAKTYFNFKENVDPLFHNDALLPYISPVFNENVFSDLRPLL